MCSSGWTQPRTGQKKTVCDVVLGLQSADLSVECYPRECKPHNTPHLRGIRVSVANVISTETKFVDIWSPTYKYPHLKNFTFV